MDKAKQLISLDICPGLSLSVRSAGNYQNGPRVPSWSLGPWYYHLLWIARDHVQLCTVLCCTQVGCCSSTRYYTHLMHECTHDLTVHIPMWTVYLYWFQCMIQQLLQSIGLHVGKTGYVGIRTWSRMAARSNSIHVRSAYDIMSNN